jgi:hypothetical protein
MTLNLCHVTAIASIIAVFICLPQSSSFSIPISASTRTNYRSTNLFATDNSSKTRRNILGLALPLTVALIANAPFLAVMSKPPTENERETMLTEWCKGEYCTLLGGGAGYFEGASATVDAVYNSDLEMPSVEEYQEQSRIAAELAINNNSQ